MKKGNIIAHTMTTLLIVKSMHIIMLHITIPMVCFRVFSTGRDFMGFHCKFFSSFFLNCATLEPGGASLLPFFPVGGCLATADCFGKNGCFLGLGTIEGFEDVSEAEPVMTGFGVLVCCA